MSFAKIWIWSDLKSSQHFLIRVTRPSEHNQGPAVLLGVRHTSEGMEQTRTWHDKAYSRFPCDEADGLRGVAGRLLVPHPDVVNADLKAISLSYFEPLIHIKLLFDLYSPNCLRCKLCLMMCLKCINCKIILNFLATTLTLTSFCSKLEKKIALRRLKRCCWCSNLFNWLILTTYALKC